MDAVSLAASIPPESANVRGMCDLNKLEKELSVKVAFCGDGHVLLASARAKLQKKCFVLCNMLSHYHWRLSGRDVSFESMVATERRSELMQ